MIFYTTLLLCLFTLASGRWQQGPKETNVESEPGMRKGDHEIAKCITQSTWDLLL
jgi:hypothetical protein